MANNGPREHQRNKEQGTACKDNRHSETETRANIIGVKGLRHVEGSPGNREIRRQEQPVHPGHSSGRKKSVVAQEGSGRGAPTGMVVSRVRRLPALVGSHRR